MPTFYIANVCNESMVRDQSILERHMLNGISASAERMLWLAGDGDIVLGMRPISQRILELRNQYEPEIGSPRWAFPKRAEDGTPILLEEGAIISSLRDLKAEGIFDAGTWKVGAYYNSGAVSECARLLDARLEFDSEFMRFCGADILNSKCQFRQLASNIEVNLADGAVCSGRDQFVSVTLSLISEFGKVIVKQDRHAGSAGNIALSLNTQSLIGASRTILLGADRHAQCAAVYDELRLRHEAPIVVERYYDTEEIMYCEFTISVDVVELLGFGVLRTDASGDPRGNSAPTWSGFEIPGPDIGVFVQDFVSMARNLAIFYQSLGYRGRVNVDGIYTADGKVVINEVNGRLGGCSHIHDIARRHHGTKYWDRVFITSRIRRKVSSFDEYLSNLRRAGVEFDPKRGMGVLTLVDDTSATSEIEYMVLAESRSQALEMEHCGVMRGQ